MLDEDIMRYVREIEGECKVVECGNIQSVEKFVEAVDSLLTDICGLIVERTAKKKK